MTDGFTNFVPFNVNALIRNCAKYGDRTAWVEGDRKLSFFEVISSISKIVVALQSLGFKKGDRIVVDQIDGIDLAMLILGIQSLGCVFVPGPFGRGGIPMEHICDKCKPAGIVTGCKTRDGWILLPSVSVVAFADMQRLLDTVCGRSGFSFEDEPASFDLATLVFTSGSTGLPKAIALSHWKMVRSAIMVNIVQQITEEDRVGLVLPLNFDYGLNYLYISLLAGSGLVFLPRIAPVIYLPQVCEHEVTVLPLMPAFMSAIHSNIDRLRGLVSERVCLICSSGGPVRQQMVSTLTNIFPSAQFMAMYGFSEAFRCSYLPVHATDLIERSVGIPFPSIEVRILEDDGKECAPFEIGTLVQFGGTVFDGYFQDEKSTEEKFMDVQIGSGVVVKGVISGDLAYRDDEGFIYIAGRKDDLIKRAGQRVNISEIEAFYSELLPDWNTVISRKNIEVDTDLFLLIDVQDTELKAPTAIRSFLDRQNEIPSRFQIDQLVLVDGFELTANDGKVDRKRSLAKGKIIEL